MASEAIGRAFDSRRARQTLTAFQTEIPMRSCAALAVSLLVLACLVVVSLSVLERRVRGVEVVS